MEQYKYVIVGNSAGAMSAARALRKSDDSGSLLMLSEERYPAYSRPLIAKHLSEAKSIDKMRLVAPAFYEDNAIDLSLLEHISPIEWDNVVLYGEYQLNKRPIRP